MNKALFLGAALLLTPFPALSQQAQQPQDQQAQQSQDRNSNYSEQDSYAESDNERDSRREDLLERLSKSDLRERLASAVERIERACGNDIERFCGDITPGGGRIANCMQAYSDQLSRRCRFTLRIATRRVQQAVENIADTCMGGIREQCGDADNVRQCVEEKRSALPQSCQTIVAALHHAGQALAARVQEHEQGAGSQAAAGQGPSQGTTAPSQGATAQATGEQTGPGHAAPSLRGMPVFSSDGKNLGQIVQVERGPDGKIQSVQIQIGRMLGLGEKVITIDGSKLEQLADRIRLMMNSDQVRGLPEAKTPGSAQK